jgi:hypothetical protein
MYLEYMSWEFKDPARSTVSVYSWDMLSDRGDLYAACRAPQAGG